MLWASVSCVIYADCNSLLCGAMDEDSMRPPWAVLIDRGSRSCFWGCGRIPLSKIFVGHLVILTFIFNSECISALHAFVLFYYVDHLWVSYIASKLMKQSLHAPFYTFCFKFGSYHIKAVVLLCTTLQSLPLALDVDGAFLYLFPV